MMPVLSGIDLYHEVTRAHPWLASRFVLLTGAAQGPEVDALLKKPEVRVVEKPLERQTPAGPLPRDRRQRRPAQRPRRLAGPEPPLPA